MTTLIRDGKEGLRPPLVHRAQHVSLGNKCKSCSFSVPPLPAACQGRAAWDGVAVDGVDGGISFYKIQDRTWDFDFDLTSGSGSYVDYEHESDADYWQNFLVLKV